MDTKNSENQTNRRKFLSNSVKGAVGAIALSNPPGGKGFPTIVLQGFRKKFAIKSY